MASLPTALVLPEAQCFEFTRQSSDLSETNIVAQGQLSVVDVPPRFAGPSTASSSSAPTAIMFIGEWAYPLCGQPCLRVAPGQLLLPAGDGSDPAAASQESYWFIRVAESDAAALDRVVSGHVMMGGAPEAEVHAVATAPAPGHAPAAASGVSAGIIGAGSVLSSAIVTTGSLIGSGIRWTGRMLQSSTKPVAEPVVVSDSTKTVVSAARSAADSAVHVSGAVLGAVTAAASSVGSWVAREVAKSSVAQRLQSGESSATFIAAKDVACSSIVAITTVFDGMEAASKQVVSDTCHATRDFIDHRYGAEAGAVAGDAAASVVGLTKTASNLRRVGVRPFVSSTARYALSETIAAGAGGEGGGGGAGAAPSATVVAAPVPPPRRKHV